MGVSSGRPKVSDLSFQVYAKAVHPEWFAVRGHRRIAQEGWEADVRIIEEGHAVSFRSGDVRLTEVLVGPRTSLPEPGRLFQSPVRRERSTTLEPGNVIVYQTCFDVERVDPEVFAHLCEEIVLDGSRGGLLHRLARSTGWRRRRSATSPSTPGSGG